MKASSEQVMESLIEAAKNETTATTAIMVLLAHVNEYKIPDLIDSLIESNVIKANES
ncbi:hypothetical protein K08M3_52230 [Vibrio alginolyticus]|jgi:molybdenum cofactor biosynthesis enzyme MoaA|uniref:Uncharacterized protein n=2 Tax=Vibrio harveyi group TaxID=717610 RepID=A0A1W6UVJ9_VIBAL|nr:MULTISPECIES: hypothetical protein [Vibrio harveyi group]ARP06707.1 hypothetical protein K04M1_51840 [Vibrio alginolyticus]ARP11832.1 hypothetical protein K04M3_52630 [Vibrio alginolyticus]ARP16885.1 hypothetical protein K04M5_52330 [Vibrio alginolyticus]ARP21922.1 hypothetical protein K05K4_52200 [Vibrio alginolyticus]ARP27010.1 hypothetical protein K06K5_52100 [Vibrio alginolyticus]